MSEHRETQESIYRWAEETFGPAEPGSPRSALRLLAEVVELCMACGASGETVNKAALDAIDAVMDKRLERRTLPVLFSHGKRLPAEIPAEAADVQVTLYVLAGREDFDLHAETDAKMTINRSRRWRSHGDGTGQHIADVPSAPPGPVGEARDR